MSRRSSSRNTRRLPSPIRRTLQIMLILGLGAVVSWLPPPLVKLLPDEAREIVELAADTRLAIFDVFGWGAPPLPPGALPKVAGRFSDAKRLLYEQVQAGHRETFYCGCSYSTKKKVSLGSCELSSLRSIARAKRVEAEHVMPASRIGEGRRCWRSPQRFSQCRNKDEVLSGRDCCLRVDEVFSTAHNDLHNLQPSVGQINGQRSNFNWAERVPDGETYGGCEIRIDSGTREVEPPESRRGEIARTMFYMRDTYGLTFGWGEERMYRDWNNADPPDEWERERERRITRIQGVPNDYIRNYRILK